MIRAESKKDHSHSFMEGRESRMPSSSLASIIHFTESPFTSNLNRELSHSQLRGTAAILPQPLRSLYLSHYLLSTMQLLRLG